MLSPIISLILYWLEIGPAHTNQPRQSGIDLLNQLRCSPTQMAGVTSAVIGRAAGHSGGGQE